jgi:hypothetical protein
MLDKESKRHKLMESVKMRPLRKLNGRTRQDNNKYGIIRKEV